MPISAIFLKHWSKSKRKCRQLFHNKTVNLKIFQELNLTQNLDGHCVKSVQIRRFSAPYFLAFGLRYFVFGHFSRSVYKHISDLCKKASRKITASSPITSYMSLPKRHQLINSFFKAQSNYCHLIWMCHSRGNIRNIHQLHKSYLRILCNNKQLSFN